MEINHITLPTLSLGELSFSDVWYKNIRFAVGLRYELYDYDKFLYQEGNQGFDVGTEHFFSYFAQMHYETFDKAYFPTKGISARASYSLYTDNFTKYDDHAPFSAIKGYCQGVIPVTRRFSILPAIYGRFLIGKDIPYSKLNAMGGGCARTFPATATTICRDKQCGINKECVTDRKHEIPPTDGKCALSDVNGQLCAECKQAEVPVGTGYHVRLWYRLRFG